MPITLGFKEAAARVQNIDNLLEIAKALKPNSLHEINVFFEFESSEDLITFCSLIKSIDTIRDLDKLEENKKRISDELDVLEAQKAGIEKEIEDLKTKKTKKLASG